MLVISAWLDEFHMLFFGNQTPLCFLPVVNFYQIVRNMSL